MPHFVQVTRVYGQQDFPSWMNMDVVAHMNVYQSDPPLTAVELAYIGTPTGFAPNQTYGPQVIYVREAPGEILTRAKLDA